MYLLHAATQELEDDDPLEFGNQVIVKDVPGVFKEFSQALQMEKG